jgi:hypothetical protein
MKDRFKRFLKSSTQIDPVIQNQALSRSCAGRIVNALTIIVVIFCLALWITAFLLLKDRLFTETFSGNLLTDLTCSTFFGGLAIAILLGAIAGNFLRRAFWEILIKSKSK